jgi:hypothetical protein
MLMSAVQVQKDAGGLKVFRTDSLSARPHGHRGEPTTQPDAEQDAAVVSGEAVLLRLSVRSGGMCALSYSADGECFVALGEPFKAVSDSWIGAKVGLFCNGPDGKPSKGFVDVDWFRFTW